MVAAATVGAAAIGAVGTGIASSNAAGAQTAAANDATNAQLGMFDVTQQNLHPFVNAGVSATGGLNYLLGGTGDASTTGYSAYGLPAGYFLQTFAPTEAQLEQTPGYKFNLSQGLKSVQNSNAARGLGVSGAAMKDAAAYATGLADSTFQTQANNFYTGQGNAFNRLFDLANMGENAGANVGSAATSTGQSVGSNMIGAGNANAAAMMATANSASNGANNIGNMFLLNSLMKSNGGAGIFGSSAPTPTYGP